MPAKTKRKAKPSSKRKYRGLTRLDPTRTVTLRRAFAATLRRQFARLKAAILLLIDKEDAFGLKADEQAGVRIGNANPEGCNQYTGPGCGGGNDSNVQEKPTYSMVRLEMRMPYGTVEQRQSGVLEVHKNASKEQLRNLLKNINQDEISLKGMVDFDGTSYVWEVPRGSEGVNHSRLAEHLGVTVGFSMRFFVDQGKDGQPLISTHAGIQASGMVKKWADEQGLTANTRWRFSTSPEKLKEFQKWLREQFGSQVAGKNQKDLWQKFIEEGFRKGSGRSFDDVRQSRLRSERPELFTSARQGSVGDFYQGSRDEFLRSSFARPETIEKVQLLAERVYSDLDGITEEMGTRMSRTLAEGLTRGQHPNEIARALADEVDIGRGRAETIARTECLPGDALVDGAVVRTIFRRWYVGSMFEIETKNGGKLSATANHPVLTIRGWVSASRLQQGDHLIRSRRQENLGASGNKNVQGLPAKIGEIFESLRAVGVIERIRGSKDDFHGDGTDSDVEVLRPNGHLKVGGFSPLYKHVVQLSLESTRHLPADLLGYCASCSGLLPVDQRVCLVCGAEGHARLNESVSDASPADVKHFGNSGDRSARQVQADDFLHVDVPQLVGNAALIPSSGLGLGIGPNGGACLTNSFDNPFTVVSIPAGDFLGGYPGEVEIDEVVSVRIRKFTGYVYNLETVQGYYTTQGYYTGNCIRAHAEGQLDSFKTLGVEEVGVAVEWATANDDKVCPKCQSLEGIVLKIDEARGLLPRHPGCRCAWIPANVGEVSDAQTRTQAGVEEALEESGIDDVSVDSDRPESILNSEQMSLAAEFQKQAMAVAERQW